jgi:hypothetical protein
MKRMLRDAMAGIWPEKQARRREVAVADDYLAWSVSRSARLLASSVEGLRWEAASYYEHSEAKRLLASMVGGGASSDWRRWLELWDIAALESWLKRLRD